MEFNQIRSKFSGQKSRWIQIKEPKEEVGVVFEELESEDGEDSENSEKSAHRPGRPGRGWGRRRSGRGWGLMI